MSKNLLADKKFRKHSWVWVKKSLKPYAKSHQICVRCGCTCTKKDTPAGRRPHFEIGSRYSSMRRAPRCNGILTVTP